MITIEQLSLVCRKAKTSRLLRFLEPLNDTMDRYEIHKNGKRQAAFIAQIAHESLEFTYTQELASGRDYDHRADLGNTRDEAIKIASAHGKTAGTWWKGRGLLQVTGYSNYLACGKSLGLDLLNNPELLEQPDHACHSAGWFWHDFKHLNDLADLSDFRGITKKINGGYNHLEERIKYHVIALEVFGVTKGAP